MSRRTYNKLSAWEKVYQLPIKADDYGRYSWCKNGTMALMFNKISEEDIKKITDAINGVTKHIIKGLTVVESDFYQDGEYIFCVRGWGNLTGTGALNLSEEDALKIQDGFIKHIMKSLT